MKKKTSVVGITILLFTTILNGCIQESSLDKVQNKIEETKTVEEPKTVYIDDDYNNTISGWGVDHFDKIQDGINNVTRGDTVYIYNGI